MRDTSPFLAASRSRPLQIRFHDLFVDPPGEQQRDVDIDAVGDQAGDGRQPRGRARHLDHQIVAADVGPQALRFGQCAGGIVRQIGRNLDADIAVGTAGRLIHRAQCVRRLPDVLDRQMFENLARGAVVRAQQPRDGVVIGVGAADGLLEDGRVRRDAAQAVVVDELFQGAACDKIAGYEIEPHGLAAIRKRAQWIHDRLFLDRRVLGRFGNKLDAFLDSNGSGNERFGAVSLYPGQARISATNPSDGATGKTNKMPGRSRDTAVPEHYFSRTISKCTVLSNWPRVCLPECGSSLVWPGLRR